MKEDRVVIAEHDVRDYIASLLFNGEEGFRVLPLTERQLSRELAYRNYRHNRLDAPDLTPQQWHHVFGDSITEFEARFQREQDSPQQSDRALHNTEAILDQSETRQESVTAEADDLSPVIVRESLLNITPGRKRA